MADDTQTLLDGLHARGGSYFFSPYNSRILGWVREALVEGDRIIKDDPAYASIEKGMSYVLGQQSLAPLPQYVPRFIVNQTKKAIRTHIASLTSIRPLFNFKTYNPQFEEQAFLLNRLMQMWWMNTAADRSLADALAYALTAGAGDLVIEFDPKFNNGDNRMIPRDPRDTVPFRPTRSGNIQDWEGVILRELKSHNALAGAYPDHAKEFSTDVQDKWGQVFSRFLRVLPITTPVSTLDGITGGKRRGVAGVPEVTLYRVYLNDNSINETTEPVLMGDPGTNWSYMVQPGERLYPRRRLIVCTERIILYDGPNQYWHGNYPVVRLRLDRWPWQFMGLSLVNDLTPLQDALNEFVNSIFMTLSQWVNRGMIADKNAMPDSVFRRIDSRQKNWKLRVNPTMGDAFKMVDGPQLPPWTMEFGKALFQKFDELSGTANLQNLMQLRQLPGADTIEKYYASLTPEMEQEGRNLEIGLREIAEMVKVNIFQFYSRERRILMLGSPGSPIEDLDFDPNTLVPALQPIDEKGQPVKGYTPELDAKLPREERARFFHKMFAFYIEQGSLLTRKSQENKMMAVQLSRQGYMDFWTLMETLEIPNVGQPPPIPLPMKDWTPVIDPVTGAVIPPALEIRVPTTITERLQCQSQMGIGQTTNSAGRKATAQSPPTLQPGSNGNPTISESS